MGGYVGHAGGLALRRMNADGVSVGLSHVSATQLRVVNLVSELPVRNRSLVGFLGL